MKWQHFQLCAWLGILPGFSLAQTSAIPFKPESASGSVLGNGAFAVLVISLLVIGAVLFIRKHLQLGPQSNAASRHLRILETQRIGPKALLSVIEFEGERYLIAQSEQGIQCLLAGAAAKQAFPSQTKHDFAEQATRDINGSERLHQEGN